MLSQPATPRTGQAACQALLLTAPRDAVHQESQGLSDCSLLVLGTEMGCKAEMGAVLSCGPIQEVASWQKK